METARIASVTVSRFLIGGNPFSGFSHQGRDKDREMMRYFTAARIKEVLFEAERLGITAMVARVDPHMLRLRMEYCEEGGKLTWLAQSVGPLDSCAAQAAEWGASALHVHGGVMDNMVAQKEFDGIKRGIAAIRSHGMAAGVAGHNVRVFEWAEKNLEVDYYMCCHYNPSPREDSPEYVPGRKENYREEDRQAMVAVARTLRKPVIHYKILAAGRNKPEETFAFCGRVMKPDDLVCVGVYPKDDPGMLRRDVELFGKYCRSDIIPS